MLVDVHSLSLLLTAFEIAFVYCAVGVFDYAEPASFIVVVRPLINFSIRKIESSFSVHLIVVILPCILRPISPCCGAFAMEVILFKISFVYLAVCPSEFSLPVLRVVEVISRINVLPFELFDAKTMALILTKLSHVNCAICIVESAVPFHHHLVIVLDELPFIAVSKWKYHATVFKLILDPQSFDDSAVVPHLKTKPVFDRIV